MKFDYGILLWVKNTFIALLFVQISLRHLYYVLFTGLNLVKFYNCHIIAYRIGTLELRNPIRTS